MADISPAYPATEQRAAWPGFGWARVGVLAGLAGGLGAAAFNSVMGERVLGEAILLEEAGAEHVSAIPELFTRGEQQGGMVVGELVLGAGLGLVLAGAALVAGPAFLGPTRRAWLALVAAGGWALLVLPAITYPALPPGVESSLPIGTRQLSYLALVGAGILGTVLARLVWLRLGGRLRPPATLIAFLLPAALAVSLLPSEHMGTAVEDGLLVRFRAAAIGSQAIFWALTALVGLWLIDRRLTSAPHRAFAARSTSGRSSGSGRS
jgi:Probable cobalt transporter subunit (CbtA)